MRIWILLLLFLVLLLRILKRIICFLNSMGILICLIPYLFDKLFNSFSVAGFVFHNFRLMWFWFLAIGLIFILLLILLLFLSFISLLFDMFNHFFHCFFTLCRCWCFLFLLLWSGSLFFTLVHIFLHVFSFVLVISFHHLVFGRWFVLIKSSVNGINIFHFIFSFMELFRCLLIIRSRFWSADFVWICKESIDVNDIL